MKLLRLKDAPGRDAGPVFRNRSWRAVAAASGVMAGITAYVALPKGEATGVVLIAVPALVTLFFVALLALRLRLCLRPENWLLRIGREGLYIHLRSFMNHHLPEDTPTVLFLEDKEITGVCLRREDRYFPGRHRGTSHDRFSYIDLVTAFAGGAADVDALAKALHEERHLPGKARMDFPVRLVAPLHEGDPAIVRLVWDQIRPGEEVAIAALEARFPRLPDAHSTPPRWSSLDDAAKEALIARLWEMGHVDDAEQLVRIHLEVGKHRARAYLEEHFERR